VLRLRASLGGPGVSVGNSQALPRSIAPGHYGSPLRQPWAKFSTFNASSARDDDPVPFQRASARAIQRCKCSWAVRLERCISGCSAPSGRYAKCNAAKPALRPLAATSDPGSSLLGARWDARFRTRGNHLSQDSLHSASLVRGKGLATAAPADHEEQRFLSGTRYFSLV